MIPARRVEAGETAAHEEIHALLTRAFAFMEGRIDPPSSLHRLDLSGIAFQCETGEVWVIGAPIKACVFFTLLSDRVYLGKLAVDHDARGAGHARRLVDLAKSRAQARGLALLELETRIELVENHATFAAMGFCKTEETAHDGYDRPTGIIMQMVL